ncbi:MULTISPECIES: ATP-binding protein [Planktothrix]|uniref:Photomixotrophic growth related protein PmgA n=2 Tax=Planktothrix TaxID=54304 RepID=A0A4P6A4R1_PLAAG|nr:MULTISPECIES: anti-sigma regulatory factor [Planktothrix]GDZ96137.1 photomixotrophic growth related protein PmgA [Planktothrix agardhii CCAP 1459/11A]CAC5345990.1 Histidine kinase-, DNA gyrase B-, and HSP90-like ATPase family protein [Planktothrix rubescens NIVA-CYA 18]CAD5916560.1 Putative Anti-Sigma regulatory factor (Ser/Thr protein kinase) [Planktothrix rubescens]CAD5950423.1 Putative Anti-Sigma regulatory factor (Ser/Thr protein kinase) [Planktothrix rubescens NIVA-CYA 18]
MIALTSRPVKRNWVTISFASTLYLCPVLDLLLYDIPDPLQAEIRLGLQEALVNAAKHGNKLDPSKTVVVRFCLIQDYCWWIISDQGGGFKPPCQCQLRQEEDCEQETHDSNLPHDEHECGRGLYILYQIFDRVQWNRTGTELTLCKKVATAYRRQDW